MPTKIILNTTPPLEARPIGFFISTETSDNDIQRGQQVFTRYKVGIVNGGGAFVKLGELNVPITAGAHYDTIAAQLGPLRDFIINFHVNNGYVAGTAA